MSNKNTSELLRDLESNLINRRSDLYKDMHSTNDIDEQNQIENSLNINEINRIDKILKSLKKL
jgi:hypothetical protein